MELLIPPGKGENLEEGIKELLLRMIDLVSPFIPEGVMNQILKPYSEILRGWGMG